MTDPRSVTAAYVNRTEFHVTPSGGPGEVIVPVYRPSKVAPEIGGSIRPAGWLTTTAGPSHPRMTTTVPAVFNLSEPKVAPSHQQIMADQLVQLCAEDLPLRLTESQHNVAAAGVRERFVVPAAVRASQGASTVIHGYQVSNAISFALRPARAVDTPGAQGIGG